MTATNCHGTEITTHTTTVILPFVAPPSSPASFLQSEPSSVTQSPGGILSMNSISDSMYSPDGRPSIFAIGPYAYETQLVSPPVFSAFTTEPSTAPFTPPPESYHLTTPSSPEVPFAQMLDSQRLQLLPYEFQCYQFHPGSPVGQLISPSSGISHSGTSSPFPDAEFAAARIHFPEFRIGDPPKLFNKISRHDYEDSRSNPCNGGDCSNEKSPVDNEETLPQQHQNHRSATLGSAKEFNFDNPDGGDSRDAISSSGWWSNENVVAMDDEPSNNWSFPKMQHSIS